MSSSVVKEETRDSYIDFLRAVGLLLLVVAHTWAPLTLSTIRTFDVPLMVIVSAMCYKPIKQDFHSIKKYMWKRFLRIYIPVFIFVNLFFLLTWVLEGHYDLTYYSVYHYIGSLFLLNHPSIGYVWIMRVFLMMALVLPFIFPIFRKMNVLQLVISFICIILLQEFMINLFTSIPNVIIRYMLSETVLYIIGYSLFTVIGLHINKLSKSKGMILTISGLLGCCLYIILTGNWFPQADKYPPHGLYLLWGWTGSCILITCKPILQKIATWNFWSYLSKNSMWIYLWHIVPIYIMLPINNRPDYWIERYVIVLGVALILNFIYHKCISRLPSYVHKYIS